MGSLLVKIWAGMEKGGVCYHHFFEFSDVVEGGKGWMNWAPPPGWKMGICS